MSGTNLHDPRLFADSQSPTEFERAFKFARRQAERLTANYPDFFPMYTKGGNWKHTSDSWTHWCEGFFPGILRLLHMRDRDPWARAMAERYTTPLEARKGDRDVHDLGFIFLTTYLRWYRLTGGDALRRVVIEAARTLAMRFQERGRYLCSFFGPESLFIDIMMNVPILYWAARETGDKRLRDLADPHTETTAHYLVRADGSCVHEGILNSSTGKFLREGTQPGLRPSSCWARGLAWAFYGFGTVYSYTAEPVHLEIAERTARYYLDHTPNGKISLWDFDAEHDPTAERIYDSSTAAIAASGLWNLSLLTPDQNRRESYRAHTLETLRKRSSREFLATDKSEQEGILLHAVYHYHKGLGVDQSVICGDHYFVEALFKVLTNTPSVAV